jgi:ribulose bisphosphate carboxylase small subunit
MIQRMGRVNRFAKNEQFQRDIKDGNLMTNVHILREQIHNYPIYPKNVVQKTLEEISEVCGKLTSEQELVEIADKVYDIGYEYEDLKEFNEGLWNEDINNFEEKVVAGAHRDWVEDIIEKSDRTIDVLPIENLKEYEDYMEEGLFIEANMLLVPIHISTFYKLKQKNLVVQTELATIVDSHYDKNKGLVV